MAGKENKEIKRFSASVPGLLLKICLIVGASVGLVLAADSGSSSAGESHLKNGSFEEGQTWTGSYQSPDQGNVPAWNTTATDGKIELFRKNKNVYKIGRASCRERV